jgi:hypothetical protein
LLLVAIEIRQHRPGSDIEDFIRAGFEVFRGDPAWVAPLGMMIRERLDPRKDPCHAHVDTALFTAWRRGRLVGRVSASVDHAWQSLWKNDTGHFGYFDTIDDEEIASALLARAEAWLRDRGMKRICGPMSLTANQEIGLLVEGFEHPPVVDMGHSRRYQGELAERSGYRKEKDLYAWRYESTGHVNARTLKAWETVRALPEVRMRSMNLRVLRQELGTIMEIYNENWAGKWGHVPISIAEVDKMAKDLRLVLDPSIAFIAEIEGRPAGMCIAVPNLNEAIADMGGRLLPLNWARLLWRTKLRTLHSSRLILLGVREQYRRMKRYGGLSAAMYVEVAQRGFAKGYRWAELSWTREDDRPINLGIESMGARIYKKYRVYEKQIVA